MGQKDADGMANSVDPDQRSSLIWVYIVCPDLKNIRVFYFCNCLIMICMKPGKCGDKFYQVHPKIVDRRLGNQCGPTSDCS